MHRSDALTRSNMKANRHHSEQTSTAQGPKPQAQSCPILHTSAGAAESLPGQLRGKRRPRRPSPAAAPSSAKGARAKCILLGISQTRQTSGITSILKLSDKWEGPTTPSRAVQSSRAEQSTRDRTTMPGALPNNVGTCCILMSQVCVGPARRIIKIDASTVLTPVSGLNTETCDSSNRMQPLTPAAHSLHLSALLCCLASQKDKVLTSSIGQQQSRPYASTQTGRPHRCRKCLPAGDLQTPT